MVLRKKSENLDVFPELEIVTDYTLNSFLKWSEMRVPLAAMKVSNYNIQKSSPTVIGARGCFVKILKAAYEPEHFVQKLTFFKKGGVVLGVESGIRKLKDTEISRMHAWRRF